MSTLNQFNWTILQECLVSQQLAPSQRQLVADQLHQVAELAFEESDFTLAEGAQLLAQVALLSKEIDADDPQLSRELFTFVVQHIPALQRTDHAEIGKFSQWVGENWGEYLEENEDAPETFGESWDSESGQEDEPQNEYLEDASAAAGHIQLLLSAVETVTTSEFDSPPQPPATEKNTATGPSATVADNDVVIVEPDSLISDEEIREAFLDDATRCLDSMEKSSLVIEQAGSDKDSLDQFCRELHTLKGASASVGLASLAAYVHDVESFLIESGGQSDQETVESMLGAVDRVRRVVDQINGVQVEPPSQPSIPAAPATVSPIQATPTSAVSSVNITNHGKTDNGEDSLIRIRSSKLDRLMDMLAELVVLRNRRESHIAEFAVLEEELSRCSTRLSFCEDNGEFSPTGQHRPGPTNVLSSGSLTMSEISKDISVVSNGIRELQKPVSQDNLAISHFIRDFRQELMQLRRIPLSGLFNRLQRAVRDAAKTENKQIRLNVIGDETGLEQELQERLYEPLLHIIRNAVSHGIESESERHRQGKPVAGQITLEAESNSQLLVICITDDGGGLDYDAIRRRAVEKGLIGGNQALAKQELGRLIFHPGFSTRDQASQVSGRGVGMDIVATTIDQLRGKIEIDSEPGKGTTMRLVVPLRSGIEHTMIFRSAGQLYALPMQAVSAARKSKQQLAGMQTLSLASLLSMPKSSEQNEKQVLLLRNTSKLSGESSPAADAGVGLEIDEIVGPEEVVVRSLPSLLKNHPLFCGVTLSGAGESVFLLDGNKLLEFIQRFGSDSKDALRPEETARQRKRILIVDDSLSARRMLANKLSALNFNITEAGDGIEALEKLRHEAFDLVLTDLDMPRLGGLEMLFDMQQGRYKNSPPVVVVSSRSAEQFKQRAVENGAVDYLTKPVVDDSLLHLLTELDLIQDESDGNDYE